MPECCLPILKIYHKLNIAKKDIAQVVYWFEEVVESDDTETIQSLEIFNFSLLILFA